MTIHPGKLRNRLTIEAPIRTVNSMGESMLSWREVRRVWANVEGVQSRELLANSRQEFDVSHRVRMRYHADLTNNHRLNWEGRVLEIVSLLEHGNRTEHEAICREAVPA